MIFGPINNSQRSISGLSIVVNMTNNQVIIRRDHSLENDPLVFEIEKNITMLMCTKIGSNKWSKAKKKGSLTFDFG